MSLTADSPLQYGTTYDLPGAANDASPSGSADSAEYVVVGNGIVMHRTEHVHRSLEEQEMTTPGQQSASCAVDCIKKGNAHLVVISPEGNVWEQAREVARDTTHLSMTRVPLAGLALNFLSIPDSLLVLDLSGTGITELPSALSSCVALEELNLSANPLARMGESDTIQALFSLSSLRVLLMDQCGLELLPEELASLSRLRILGLRHNVLTYIPSWIHVLELDCLLLEGNDMPEPWSLVLGPLVQPMMSDFTRYFALLNTTGSNVHTPVSPASAPGRSGRSFSASHASPSPTLARRATRDFKSFSFRAPKGNDDDSTWRRITRRTTSGTNSPAADGNGPRSPYSASGSQADESFPGTPTHPTLPGGFVPGLFTTYLPLPQLAPPVSIPTARSHRIPCFLPVFDNTPDAGGIEVPSEHEDYVRNILAYLRDLDSLLPSHQTHPLVVNSSDPSAEMRSPPAILPPSAARKSKKRVNVDSVRCQRVVAEILDTERTYVAGLNELTDIYIRRARESPEGSGSDERILPVELERAVFGHVEGIVHFHNAVFLPLLEQAAASVLAVQRRDINDDALVTEVAAGAARVAEVFSNHAAYFKMYMNYVNQCDTALHYVSAWTEGESVRGQMARVSRRPSAPLNQIVSLGRRLNRSTDNEPRDLWSSLSQNQQRRVYQYVRRCREDPRHSQLNLEAYLLLPVQRIPRYRMLLEQLVQCTSPELVPNAHAATVEALEHIALVVSWVNEGKRQSEQGQRLAQWQKRLRSSNTPLLLPHRRLICDDSMRLRRVVRRSSSRDGYSDMDVLEQTSMDMKVQVLLCNDLIAIVAQQSEPTIPREERRDQMPDSVELVLTLRPCTVATPTDSGLPPAPPANVSGSIHLRIVDTRCIVYLTVPSERDALRWCDAINAQTF